MIRLTKGETNELLIKISEDNYIYGLIFKLIYLYGKDGMSILSLKWTDIDFNKRTINLKGTVFPLSRFVESDLLRLKENSHTDYCFLDSAVDVVRSIDVLRKKLRYYMNSSVKKLDVNHKIKHVALSITDLRRLRGQHLFMDGVPLKLIMDLYVQGEGTSTQFKRYLEYDSLMVSKFPCSSMNELFDVYTDLAIFDFESESETILNFAVSYGDMDFVIYLSKDELGFVGDDVGDSVKEKLQLLFDGGLLSSLGVLGDSEYLMVDGFSFVKL